ncbi:protease inhibitor I42 family protein [Pseudomonas sp. UBA6310]|uniref:protease inhibitor I42 family protein n=1 Tax=Pseudomonas sp. UBA6310 TaxID=1947327 RepID=UPI00257C6041|nr:protease inhibitor I42 family protein [Pseudomonas sp. UBA6310]
MSVPLRLLLPAVLLLGGCAGKPPATVTLEESQASRCHPLKLYQGQTLVLSLPSDPTSGYRWQLLDAAPAVLRSLGPEVYANPEDSGDLVGSGGESTWRFQVANAGDALLALRYQQAWDADGAPARTFECALHAE